MFSAIIFKFSRHLACSSSEMCKKGMLPFWERLAWWERGAALSPPILLSCFLGTAKPGAHRSAPVGGTCDIDSDRRILLLSPHRMCCWEGQREAGIAQGGPGRFRLASKCKCDLPWGQPSLILGVERWVWEQYRVVQSGELSCDSAVRRK